ncbi:unknown [Clostridium sp. CAG:1219]|nr:unknown [Clostridium sp. CAG:1219]
MEPVKTENIKKGKYSEKRRKTIGIRRIFLLSRSFL